MRQELAKVVQDFLRKYQYGSLEYSLFLELYLSLSSNDEYIKELIQRVQQGFEYQNFILCIKNKIKEGEPLNDDEKAFVNDCPYEIYG